MEQLKEGAGGQIGVEDIGNTIFNNAEHGQKHQKLASG
tara:strand:- start:84 stop:197 length:114 start_codon:yes stop_codon:yes gene_type:complete